MQCTLPHPRFVIAYLYKRSGRITSTTTTTRTEASTSKQSCHDYTKIHTPLSCRRNSTCNTWTDGCNTCSCANGVISCTEKFCQCYWNLMGCGYKCLDNEQCVVPGMDRTCGGDAKMAPCHFPFKYRGVTYTKCITADSPSDTPWCYTDRDNSNWGYCEGCVGKCIL